MKATFDVLDQGWIPVVDESGSRQLMGIRQVLSEAHRLREISDPSPLEEYSLYRFLTVFLMDALRPKTRSNIREILKKGRFDMTQIESYITQCLTEGVSFDLFDEERPFLQNKFETDEEQSIKPVSKLDCTIPGESGHAHFEHRPIDRISFPPEKAMRLLLATYVFAISGGRGYYLNVYGIPPLFGVIKCSSLFETLIASFLPTNEIGYPFDNPPVFWRNMEPIEPGKSVPSVSWLQGMWFQTRKIQLIPDCNGNISQIYLKGGEKFENPMSWRDPFVSYRFIQKNHSLQPLLPSGKDADWRNLCDIIDVDHDHASLLLQSYQRMYNSDATITLYGLRADKQQAVYYSVHRYDLSIPFAIMEDDKVSIIRTCSTIAQRVINALDYSFEIIDRTQKELKEVECFDLDKYESHKTFPIRKPKYWMPKYIREKATTTLEQSCALLMNRILEDLTHLTDYNELISSFCQELVDSAIMSYDNSFNGIRLRADMLVHIADNREQLQRRLHWLIKQTIG